MSGTGSSTRRGNIDRRGRVGLYVTEHIRAYVDIAGVSEDRNKLERDGELEVWQRWPTGASEDRNGVPFERAPERRLQRWLAVDRCQRGHAGGRSDLRVLWLVFVLLRLEVFKGGGDECSRRCAGGGLLGEPVEGLVVEGDFLGLADAQLG